MVRKSASGGFTLIELLTVIAIIAILAAILFPVFNAAKLAAKATNSVSNAQQTGQALLLYMHDYDETVVLSGAWNTGNDVGSLPPDTVSTYTWLINPYMKDHPLTQDPLAPLNGQVLQGATGAANDLFFPQYGLNYVYLTPYDVVKQVQHPVSASQINQPAATVLIASKFSFAESKLATNNYVQFDDVGSPAVWSTVEVPDCVTADTDMMHACFANWGASDGFINDPNVEGVLAPVAGSNTGGVSGRCPNSQSVVVMADGHAKKMSAGALAAGTNWTPTLPSNLLITTDPTKYIWDLN